MRDRHLVGVGVAACAACCAPPLIGLLGLAGFAATAATVAFVGVVFGLLVGAASLLALGVRRRRATVKGVGRRAPSTSLLPHGQGPDGEHDRSGTAR